MERPTLAHGVRPVKGAMIRLNQAENRRRVRAYYEAGPTGDGLARAAHLAGVPVGVIAPNKTPRAPTSTVSSATRSRVE